MDPETKRTLITCGTSVLCIIVSNIFIFLSSKNNDKKNKNISILEQQYNKLFIPIHRLLFFSDLADCDKITRIYNVIYSNYNLSTELLREAFYKCSSKKRITYEFEEIIIDGCKCLEKALGYTKTKLSKQQKERSKTVIYSKKSYGNNMTSAVISIITGLFGTIASLSLLLRELGIVSNIERIINSVGFSYALIAIGIFFIALPVFVFILEKFQK